MGAGKILVTRPRLQAEATAKRLTALGFLPWIAPLSRIEFLDAPEMAALDRAQAILVTSANGVRGLAHAGASLKTPVLAVGDRTAEIARAAGFKDVRSASGSAERLAEYAIQTLLPSAGTVVHVRGSGVTHSPLPALRDAGFSTDDVVLYETRYDSIFDTRTLDMLRARAFDAALIYSPRSGTAMAGAVGGAMPDLAAVAISANAAAAAREAGWQGTLHVAASPDEDAMLDALVSLH